jgi:menaquinone-dependent protoporphyrinogen IX oxidase
VTTTETPKVLLVYYSFTQQTRQVATTIAEELRKRGVEVTMASIGFTDSNYAKRFSKLPMDWPITKIVSMLPAQLRRKTGDIQIPLEASTGDYDLVVIGSPTWWLTTCMPVRSYMHDEASERVLSGRPFAVFSVSRRYYKGNLKTIRELGTKHGGTFVADSHFVSAGNQVMSMWSWLVFMRHNIEKRHWFGVPMPKPNLRESYEQQATTFITGVAETTLALTPATGGS